MSLVTTNNMDRSKSYANAHVEISKGKYVEIFIPTGAMPTVKLGDDGEIVLGETVPGKDLESVDSRR